MKALRVRPESHTGGFLSVSFCLDPVFTQKLICHWTVKVNVFFFSPPVPPVRAISFPP